MKYLIASDLHGSGEHVGGLMDAWEREAADGMILLGDILYHGPRNALPDDYDTKKVIAMLNPRAYKITAVRGNCDAEVDQMVLEFPIMADYALLPLDGGRTAFVTHGHLFNIGNPPPHQPGDVLVHGHTHVHCAIPQEDYVYINPGSAALPKEGQAPSYMIYEDGVFTVKHLITGEALLRYELGK